MKNTPITEGWAQGRQTLRLGFDVFCLFPNLVVPTFLQTAVTGKSAQSSSPNIGHHFILPVCQLMSGFVFFNQVKPKMIFCFPSLVM